MNLLDNSLQSNIQQSEFILKLIPMAYEHLNNCGPVKRRIKINWTYEQDELLVRLATISIIENHDMRSLKTYENMRLNWPILNQLGMTWRHLLRRLQTLSSEINKNYLKKLCGYELIKYKGLHDLEKCVEKIALQIRLRVLDVTDIKRYGLLNDVELVNVNNQPFENEDVNIFNNYSRPISRPINLSYFNNHEMSQENVSVINHVPYQQQPLPSTSSFSYSPKSANRLINPCNLFKNINFYRNDENM